MGVPHAVVPVVDAAAFLPLVVVHHPPRQTEVWQARLLLGGISCSSCVDKITDALRAKPWLRSIDVSIITSSASVTFEGREHSSEILAIVGDLGYEGQIQEIKELPIRGTTAGAPDPSEDWWRARYAVGGMTCSSCVGNITRALEQQPWTSSADVNLLANSATVLFAGQSHVHDIVGVIEDAGYDATLESADPAHGLRSPSGRREIALLVHGMHCERCPERIEQALLDEYGDRVTIIERPSRRDPVCKLSYLPDAPNFTVRHVMARTTVVDPAFVVTVHHPPTIEERSRAMHDHERQRIMRRMLLSVAAVIPVFLIGIVFMSLVPKDNPVRAYLMQPMWAGSVSRAQWALFLLATPVFFLAADLFHARALKELRALWRPGSTTPILRRFYRFGSMNLLMSLGTSIAYFSSIGQLATNATRSSRMTTGGDQSIYFDSVVFLTTFLLAGRWLEAYTKSKTGDAVAALGKLRPTDALLVAAGEAREGSSAASDQVVKVDVDQLEVGDIVRVPHGSSPPMDGVIISGHTKMDESALTGESRSVPKWIGDAVFAGTVNQDNPITVRVSGIAGTSMLDQIVQVVRDGQTRRAPIERMADVVTGHFVPAVILIAIVTWATWLALGLSGTLPLDYLDRSTGGWPAWSLQFAIAVFVIACPCGIGLAAPTALFVGGGLAAQHGILVKGGGEAFQEASQLDCIAFDKTGTLTHGGEPVVTNYECLSSEDDVETLGMARSLEESSSHPIGKAIINLCSSKNAVSRARTQVEEVAGKGLKGTTETVDGEQCPTELLLGNEVFLAEHHVPIPSQTQEKLDGWKREGKSVALLATRVSSSSPPTHSDGAEPAEAWKLSAVFAISDPLRDEAAAVIKAIQRRGIAVWMISGDNATTAVAVGRMVGIDAENIIAGVLPEEKAERIKYLQRSLTKSPSGSRFGARTHGRAVVAMVGDGINDSPALSMADVSIAVGSGSDIAISTAKFVLLNTSLTSILTLVDLSRLVFQRVKFNFFWAMVYNLVALPVAAGVLYPIRVHGTHVRLDPVWASLCMALSSVSVICSSLLLRSALPVLGFRPTQRGR
ncbi:MAG: hypothetical protein M1826_005018 [Phylliscum demangeonii]|nr:MAG: hypothetical protein M1826_005018 [Phylliscum demangeonii]